jgi:hypothetical protein
MWRKVYTDPTPLYSQFPAIIASLTTWLLQFPAINMNFDYVPLKVHKRENLLGSDFEFSTFL